jgi:competence protein CoiA
MRYAILNGEKLEATKDGKGFCPSCSSELIPKCGNININHWAHKGERVCDPWWENETAWHRAWKSNFPKEWQEVVQFDDSGEKHIADIKTTGGWVLEFQHSFLKSDERQARTTFYKKIVWVVDGARRKTDIHQFQNVIEESDVICAKPIIRRVNFPEECRLLREWHDSTAWALFDFQEANETRLWFLLPKITASGNTYILSTSQVEFIDLHKNNQFDEIDRMVKLLLNNREQLNRINQHNRNLIKSRSFDLFMRNKTRRFRRF